MIKIFIIDADLIHHCSAQILIKKYQPNVLITCFAFATEALDFIKTYQNDNSALPDIILLDINMPVMSGFDFLESFVKFDYQLREKMKVYIVSSTVDSREITKVKQCESVDGFFKKPLSWEELSYIFE